MNNFILIAALCLASFATWAQTADPVSNTQTNGAPTSTATNTSSQASMSDVSANTNVSGVSINPCITASTQQSINGSITGGNTYSQSNTTAGNSSATGGTSNATGGTSTATGGAQRQQQSNTGTNTSSNANTVAGGKGGSSTVTVNTGTSTGSASAAPANVNSGNTTYRITYIPPIVPPTPPSTLAVGNIVMTTMACGPLQTVVKTPITGTTLGFFVDGSVQQGFTYDLAPVLDKDGRAVTYAEVPLADGSGYRMIGTQAVLFAAIVGTSNAKNIALGGGGSNGSFGQAGGGNSGSMQQLVSNIQLKACDLGTQLYKKPVAELRTVNTIGE